MKEDKKKMAFSSIVVLLSIIHIDVFITALFYIYHLGYTFNDMAVTCFFSFWAIEMLSLAGIKMKKVRYENTTYEENLNEVTDEEIIEEE